MDEVTIAESVYSDWLEMVTCGEYRNWVADEHPGGLNGWNPVYDVETYDTLTEEEYHSMLKAYYGEEKYDRLNMAEVCSAVQEKYKRLGLDRTLLTHDMCAANGLNSSKGRSDKFKEDEDSNLGQQKIAL